MTRREIVRELKLNYNCTKKENSNYDLVLNFSNIKYNILILKANSNTQITINSKNIWELKKGNLDGLRFKAINSVLINLKEFMELENRIIIFTNRPYKILKVLNESEVKDISIESSVYGSKIIYDLTKIKDILKVLPTV